PPFSTIFTYTTLFRSLIEKFGKLQQTVEVQDGSLRSRTASESGFAPVGPLSGDGKESSSGRSQVQDFNTRHLPSFEDREGLTATDRKSTRLNSSHEWI